MSTPSPTLATRAARDFIRVALRVVPSRPSVVIAGYRDTEENATVLAAAVAATDLRVVYLCDDVETARRSIGSVSGDQIATRVQLVPQRSLRGVWEFLRAETVFYTHGAYGSPAPRGRRIHVLLGHGHGPKSASPESRPTLYDPTLATTNNELWGRAVLRDQGVEESKIRVTGNVRDDVLVGSDTAGVREALGLDPAVPLVCWLPTYRTATVNGRYEWIDAGLLSDGSDWQESVRRLGQAALAAGVNVLVSTHSLDTETFDAPGLRVVDAQTLLDRGVRFYEMLAACDAVISDYSSVWVDFLITDRPVGLWCPDLAAYTTGRGFNEPGLVEVASDLLMDEQDFADFFQAVAAGRGWRGEQRRRVRDRLGLALGAGRTRAVLDTVARLADERGLRSGEGLATAAGQAGQPATEERNDPTYAA